MNKESFSFTYSAKQQAEVQKIRDKYVPQELDKMEQLRRLDAKAQQKGTMMSLILGVISALILGVGMCMCLVWNIFILGILIGIIGIIGVALAYPLYTNITKKEREKIAPEIIKLTDELLK